MGFTALFEQHLSMYAFAKKKIFFGWLNLKEYRFM